MIISHKYRFVFIRPMKVGGSSTEAAMLDVLRRHSAKKQIQSRPPHLPAEKVLSKFGDRVADYTFFTICRNPWDRALSLFFHRHEGINREALETQKKVFRDWIASAGFLFDERGSMFETPGSMFWQGYPIVDHVVRFEYLAPGLVEMSRRLGLPEPIDVSRLRIRGDMRSEESRDFRWFYDEETWKIIEIAAARDCAAFGYSKDKPKGQEDMIVTLNSKQIRNIISRANLLRKAISGEAGRDFQINPD